MISRLLKISGKRLNALMWKASFLICGETKRIEEYYGKGGFDPIGNPYGFEYSVEATTYYDEEGNIIFIRGIMEALYCSISSHGG